MGVDKKQKCACVTKLRTHTMWHDLFQKAAFTRWHAPLAYLRDWRPSLTEGRKSQLGGRADGKVPMVPYPLPPHLRMAPGPADFTVFTSQIWMQSVPPCKNPNLRSFHLFRAFQRSKQTLKNFSAFTTKLELVIEKAKRETPDCRKAGTAKVTVIFFKILWRYMPGECIKIKKTVLNSMTLERFLVIFGHKWACSAF